MKPLLVLLLVLGAVGALLFAVMNLGKNETQEPLLPPVNTGNAEPGPAVPTKLDPSKGTDRAVAKAQPSNASNGAAAGLAYSNRITGIVKNTLEQPVSGAEVTLSSVVQETFFFPEDIAKVDTSKEQKVRTDSEGRFVFLGAEPRKYTLIVKHPDYATRRDTTADVRETGTYEHPPIYLAVGASLSGYVKDEGGNLVPDALLTLDPSMFDNMGIVPDDRLTSRTDASGWYSFVNVPPGERTVTITAGGYGKLTVPRITFVKEEQISRDFTVRVAELICGVVIDDAGQGIAKATVIAIGVSNTQGTTRDQVVTNDKGEFCFENLTKGDYNVIATAKGYRSQPRNTRISTGTSNHQILLMRDAKVCGMVIDAASGKPMPSFKVRMRIWTGEGSPTSPLNDGEYTEVNSGNGEFCIEGVPPSDFVVEAVAPGYAPTYSNHFTVNQSQPVNGVMIKLGRGGTISGRVVDAEGKPIARARVVTQDNNWIDDEFQKVLGNQFPTNTTTVDVRTDEAGRFLCTNLNPDVYQIVVTAEGYMQTVRTGLRVTENGNVQIGDVQMGHGGTVRGTLYDASGKPISGGTIQLQSKETPTVLTTRTGADGKFTIQNCVPGRYTLSGMRNVGAEVNPFDQLTQAGDSAVDVIVAEGDSTNQDIRLRQ